MATYVLVPGAGGSDWYWHRVVPELEARGHDAVAVALPADDDSAGWTEYAEAIVGARRAASASGRVPSYPSSSRTVTTI